MAVFPFTSKIEAMHKKRKRELEILYTIATIKAHLRQKPDYSIKETEILEFGCGSGFQIPYLRDIGNVTASDVFYPDSIKKMGDLEFVECSIHQTPFEKDQFDVIFSSHVLEHIHNLKESFAELQRIGKPECYYAFLVPTSTWLLISLPIRYISKPIKIITLISKFLSKKNKQDINHNPKINKYKQIEQLNNASINKNKFFKAIKFLIYPGGHGAFGGFSKCYKMFKIKSWQRLFIKNGFSIIETHPLLLYAPSEWPYIPTTNYFNRYNICSSVLFILAKEKIK